MLYYFLFIFLTTSTIVHGSQAPRKFLFNDSELLRINAICDNMIRNDCLDEFPGSTVDDNVAREYFKIFVKLLHIQITSHHEIQTRKLDSLSSLYSKKDALLTEQEKTERLFELQSMQQETDLFCARISTNISHLRAKACVKDPSL